MHKKLETLDLKTYLENNSTTICKDFNVSLPAVFKRARKLNWPIKQKGK